MCTLVTRVRSRGSLIPTRAGHSQCFHDHSLPKKVAMLIVEMTKSRSLHGTWASSLCYGKGDNVLQLSPNAPYLL